MKFVVTPAVPGCERRLQEVENDAGELFRTIGLDAIADDEPPTIEMLHAYIRDGRAWVALDDHQLIIGYATASVVDDEAHLDQVSVVEAAAGNRVGVELIRTVFGWATSLNFESVTLTTFRDVPLNGPYYERLAFVELNDSQCGPMLKRILQDEVDAGIAVLPRIAMRRLL